VVNRANKSALKLVEIVVSNFPSYDDTAFFEVEPGKPEKVFFYKRAQILAADIWACFENGSFGEFQDIDQITMFADYRVPQILAYFKILEYSDELTTVLTQNQLLPNGSRMEVEIRANSIWAVEVLRKEILAQGVKIETLNAITLDFYLWDLAQEVKEEIRHTPVHKTRSIFY